MCSQRILPSSFLTSTHYSTFHACNLRGLLLNEGGYGVEVEVLLPFPQVGDSHKTSLVGIAAQTQSLHMLSNFSPDGQKNNSQYLKEDMIVTPAGEWVGMDSDELRNQNGVCVEHGATVKQTL
jgi:hypothetical protein